MLALMQAHLGEVAMPQHTPQLWLLCRRMCSAAASMPDAHALHSNACPSTMMLVLPCVQVFIFFGALTILFGTLIVLFLPESAPLCLH